MDYSAELSVKRAGCHRLTGMVSSAVISTMLASAPLYAQAAPGTGAGDPSVPAKPERGVATRPPEPGEIVVTASRREETLSRVPISVAAYSRATLDQKSVREFADITKLTTGVNFVQNAPNRGFSISIRGIDSRVGAGTSGIYIDDTPIQVRRLGPVTTNIYPQIFDLDRVEVLRGPQGTLFGAGSEGGTIRFITPQPSLDTTSLYARAEVATTDNGSPSYEAGAGYGAPIIEDRVGLRLSAYYRRDGGWIDRVDPDTGKTVEKDANYSRTVAVKGAVTFKPSDTILITPSLYYQRRFSETSDRYWVSKSSIPGITGVPQPSATFTVPFSDPGKAEFRNGDPLSQPGYERFVLAGLRSEVTLGNVKAIGNVAYFRSHASYTYDFSTAVTTTVTSGLLSRIPGFTAKSPTTDDQKNWTAELRFQPDTPNRKFNWILGVYYGHLAQTTFFGIDGSNDDFLFRVLTGNPNASADAIIGPNVQPGSYSLVQSGRSLDEQIAGFGELSYNITDKLKVTAGVRVSHARVDFSQLNEGPFSGPRTISTAKSSATPATPKFNISYQADPDNLLYATAAKGFRVGGGNAQLPATLCGPSIAAIGLKATPGSYRPDSLWSYEIGSKNRLFGRRVTVDASAYLIDWSNIQQQVFLPCQFYYVANAGKVRSTGFDLQLGFRATDHLSVGASAGYNRAKFTQTIYPGPIPGTGRNSVVVSKGDVIDQAPWTLVLNGRYDVPLGGGSAYLTGDYIYRTRNERPSPVQDPLSVAYEGYPTLPSTEQLNMRAGYNFGQVDLSLFVKNLTNDHSVIYYRHDYSGDMLYKNVSLRPRTFGVTVSLRQ